MAQQAATGEQAGAWSRIARRPAAVAGIGYTVAASGGQVAAAFADRDWPVIVNLVLSRGDRRCRPGRRLDLLVAPEKGKL